MTVLRRLVIGAQGYATSFVASNKPRQPRPGRALLRTLKLFTLRTLKLFTLGARANITGAPQTSTLPVQVPVSPADRSSAWRSVASAATVEKRAEERQQAL